jgi:hypothetical protein
VARAQAIDLSSVTVTIEAMIAWHRACIAAVRALPAEIAAEAIPSEEAELLSGGALRVFVRHPERKHRVIAAIVVPADHWTWRS